jgi:hypothetical protein
MRGLVAFAIVVSALTIALVIPDGHVCPGGGVLHSQRSALTGEVHYGCRSDPPRGIGSDATMDRRLPVRIGVILLGLMVVGAALGPPDARPATFTR